MLMYIHFCDRYIKFDRFFCHLTSIGNLYTFTDYYSRYIYLFISDAIPSPHLSVRFFILFRFNNSFSMHLLKITLRRRRRSQMTLGTDEYIFRTPLPLSRLMQCSSSVNHNVCRCRLLLDSISFFHPSLATL
jgi:hypothetical protein